MQDEIEHLLLTSLPEVHLRPDDWPMLLPLCRVRHLARGGVLFTHGQPVPFFFGTLQGEIEIRFSPANGAISVLEHVQAGRLFGLAAFASGRPSLFEARATRPTRVLALGPAAYEYLMDCVPGFARALMHEFAQRYAEDLRLLEASRHRSAIEQLNLALAQLLLSDRASQINTDGFRFLRTTQAELAELANLSRQTVNGLIAELERQHKLRAVYGGLWIAP